MKATLLAVALLALGLGAAAPAAATCMYHEIIGVDPVPADTGHTTVDALRVSIGYGECHPPPHEENA